MRNTFVVALIVVILDVPGAYAGQNGSEDVALQRYDEAISAYVALHRDVERWVPALEIWSDPRKISQAVEMMAKAMQAARPSARAGDIFDAEVGSLLRERIRDRLWYGGYNPAEILACASEDNGPATHAPPPVVNGRFSWAQPSFMLSSLVPVLPPLPEELQYRFIARDLVLIDVHANLVVDILPDAFPAGGWCWGVTCT